MDIRLASALNYYGLKNLKQAKERFGLYQDVDIKRFLLECYTEDTIKSIKPPKTDVGINDLLSKGIFFLSMLPTSKLPKRTAKIIINPQTL